jgi:hypothetical protein
MSESTELNVRRLKEENDLLRVTLQKGAERTLVDKEQLSTFIVSSEREFRAREQELLDRNSMLTQQVMEAESGMHTAEQRLQARDHELLQLNERMAQYERLNSELTSRLTNSEMDNQMKGMRVEETQRMLEDVKTARSAEAGEAGSALEEMRSRVRNLVDERANLSVKLSATEEQRLRAEQAAEAERDRVRLTSEAALLERQRADEAAQARLKAEEDARTATMRASSGLASAVQDLGAAQARAEMLQTELQNKNKSVDSLSGQLQQHQTLLSLTTKQLDDHKERHNVLLANNLELERAHQSVQQRSSNLNSQLMAAQSDLALTNRALSGTRY